MGRRIPSASRGRFGRRPPDSPWHCSPARRCSSPPTWTWFCSCRAAVPDLTLFVGGGIKSAAQVRAARAAGADFVVVGTALEERGASAADLQALVQAAAG